jgi:hypothetical protein
MLTCAKINVTPYINNDIVTFSVLGVTYYVTYPIVLMYVKSIHYVRGITEIVTPGNNM